MRAFWWCTGACVEQVDAWQQPPRWPRSLKGACAVGSYHDIQNLLVSFLFWLDVLVSAAGSPILLVVGRLCSPISSWETVIVKR
jgi:hypothetical protein